MNLREEIKQLMAKSKTSTRQLSLACGVRRQSIMRFLSGGNIHIDNLEKLLSALGKKLSLSKDSGVRPFEKRLLVDRAKLARFCEKNGIASVAIFGSVLRRDFKKNSDVDLVIKLKRPVTFFELADIEEGLAQLIGNGHKLDIVTEEGLSPLIKEEVDKLKEVLYVEAA